MANKRATLSDTAPTVPEPATPEPVVPVLAVSKHLSTERAFQRIGQHCLAQITTHQARLTAGYDVENLHQMRVGLRRLRVALGLFKALLPVPPALRQELEWLGTQLNPARDWDVLQNATLPRLTAARAEVAEVPGLAQLEQAIAAQVQQMRELARATVHGARTLAMLQAWDSWLCQRGWRSTASPRQVRRLQQRIRRAADKILARTRRAQQQAGQKLRKADPAARHRVRIATKKLRYASEFFATLNKSRQQPRHPARLRHLQDELGWLNDLAVADQLLNGLLEQQPQLAESVQAVCTRLAEQMAQGSRQVQKQWKKWV
jgi:CHAD domain-containing protein